VGNLLQPKTGGTSASGSRFPTSCCVGSLDVLTALESESATFSRDTFGESAWDIPDRASSPVKAEFSFMTESKEKIGLRKR